MSNHLPISQLINLLFSRITKPDGRSYTAAEVAKQTGISTTMISALRSGRKDNPSLKIIRSLLGFFDVSLGYMEAETIEKASAFLEMRNHSNQKRAVAFRGLEAQGLTPQMRKQVEALVRFSLDVEDAVQHDRPEPNPPIFDDEGNLVDEDEDRQSD